MILSSIHEFGLLWLLAHSGLEQRRAPMMDINGPATAVIRVARLHPRPEVHPMSGIRACTQQENAFAMTQHFSRSEYTPFWHLYVPKGAEMTSLWRDEPFALSPAGFRCLLCRHCLNTTCMCNQFSCKGCATRKDFSTA